MTILTGSLGVIGIWLVVFIVHEFGHIFAMHKYTGKWPKLKVRWWGMEVEQNKTVTLLQEGLIHGWGILAGWVMLGLFLFSAFAENLNYYILVYIICCFFDFMGVYMALSNKDKWSWKLNEFKQIRIKPQGDETNVWKEEEGRD